MSQFVRVLLLVFVYALQAVVTAEEVKGLPDIPQERILVGEKGDVPGSWVPDAKQVQEILAGVKTFISTDEPDGKSGMNANKMEIREKYSRYSVYLCGITKDGKKYVKLYFAVISDPAKRANRGAYYKVLDGGSNYWNIEYDVEKGEFINFRVNGRA